MMPILSKMAGYPTDTQLVMYEEVKPNMIERIEFSDGALEKALDELMDGDILIVQLESQLSGPYKLPTPKDYSKFVDTSLSFL